MLESHWKVEIHQSLLLLPHKMITLRRKLTILKTINMQIIMMNEEIADLLKGQKEIESRNTKTIQRIRRILTRLIWVKTKTM